MKLVNSIRHVSFATLLCAGLCATGPARAADDIVVKGDLWLKSTPELRKAFLVGAGNMIAMEMAYAQKKGGAQPPMGAMTQKAVENMTLDQLSERITGWYKANPQQADMPVMGVIWLDVVKPAAGAQ